MSDKLLQVNFTHYKQKSSFLLKRANVVLKVHKRISQFYLLTHKLQVQTKIQHIGHNLSLLRLSQGEPKLICQSTVAHLIRISVGSDMGFKHMTCWTLYTDYAFYAWYCTINWKFNIILIFQCGKLFIGEHYAGVL